jgi:hypothetical protein
VYSSYSAAGPRTTYKVGAAGPHRYFRLADCGAADMLEKMMGVAARAGHLRTRTGPSDPAMRKARVCYDHLGGEMGVQMFDSLMTSRWLAARDGDLRLTRSGEAFLDKFGVELGDSAGSRRPLCKTCLDWSQRRTHLAGAVGAALLSKIVELKWARRDKNSRALLFSAEGEAEFHRAFRG